MNQTDFHQARFTLAAMFMTAAALSSMALAREDVSGQPLHRRPVSLVAAGEWLYVANRESGTISVVETDQQIAASEFRIGKRLSDLTSVDGLPFLLAIDELEHQLILLELPGQAVKVAQQLSVPSFPVTVAYHERHKCCTVASLWSRRLAFVEFDPSSGAGESSPQRLTLRKTIDLPFAPRLQWATPDGDTLVVADSFGGRLGIVDLRNRQLLAIRTLAAHNIRGLASSADGRRLLVTHQLLNSSVPTYRERIFWGAVINNVFRSISLDELLKPIAPLNGNDAVPEAKIAHWELVPLGEPGNAAGDPAGLVVTSDGLIAVALAGVDEVVVGRPPLSLTNRRAVGRRPTVLSLSSDETTVYVANTFGDSISVVDLATAKVTRTISLGPQPKATLLDRGESLFYDARLSLDGWYSCHSCHTDGHTNGLLNDNFGDNADGTPKRILSLLGVTDTGPWAWNGSQITLAGQIEKSIKTTMRGADDKSSKENVAALEAYLRTLSPPPSLPTARGQLNLAAIERGRALFQRLGCTDCHDPPTFTSTETYDVGLSDEWGARDYNPPSLIGISQRTAHFHDNRAGTLRAVFADHHHPAEIDLPAAELADLLEFLQSL